MSYNSLSHYLIVLLACIAIGCGDAASSGQCSDLEAIAPSTDLASSPRAESGLEQLAFALTGAVIADQSTYEQVAQDVAAIKSQFPEVDDVSIYPARESTELYIEVSSEQIATQMVAGDYPEWRCLNEHFGPVEVGSIHDTGVVASLPHVLNPTRITELYADLEDVELAQSGPPVGDGPTICANWDGDKRLYLLDDASGDCPSGCTQHELSLFSVDAEGNVAEETLDENVTTIEDAQGFACPSDTWQGSR